MALVALAAWRRAPGLDPPSLWVDDAWVGFIVRYAGPLDLLNYAASVPFGLCAMLKPFHAALADPELSLQLFPFLCGLAVIPAVARLASRLTGWNSLGLLAAALLTADPRLAQVSVRVKQYSSDALVVTLLLLAGLGASRLADARWQRLLALAAGSFAAAVVSYVSLAVSVPLLHLPLAGSLRDLFTRRRSIPWRSIAVAAGFDMLVALLYFGRLRGQSRFDTQRAWTHRFVPTHSWDDLTTFLTRQVPRAFAEVLPLSGLSSWGFTTATFVLLAILAWGLVGLLSRPSRRLEGSFFALFFASLFAASAARIYPLGRRPWVFAHPVVVTLVVIAIGLVLDETRRQIAGTEAWLAGMVAATALSLALFLAPVAGYPPDCAAELVRRLDAEAKPDDLVILSRQGTYSFGYYTTKAIEPVFLNEGKKFTLRPIGWSALVLEQDSPKALPTHPLKDPARALYFVSRGRNLEWKDRKGADRSLVDAGFRQIDLASCPRTLLVTYERSGRDDARADSGAQ